MDHQTSRQKPLKAVENMQEALLGPLVIVEVICLLEITTLIIKTDCGPYFCIRPSLLSPSGKVIDIFRRDLF